MRLMSLTCYHFLAGKLFRSSLRDAQITLHRQCIWLKDVGIKLDQSAFLDPDFSTLRSCSKFDLARTSATLPLLEPEKEEKKSSPPASDTKPFSPPLTVIQDRRFR